METVEITWAQGRHVTGRLMPGNKPLGVVLAHGAGVGQDHPLMTVVRDGLADGGFPVLTFNYPYTEEGRRRPDPTPTLLSAHRAAARWFRDHVSERLAFAGRSMGGRMASMLAAEGEPCDGLILYAYPLHPAGKVDRIRADHLWQVHVPMLFFIGTRDRLARPELVDAYLRPLPNAEIVDIADADHTFKVPKRSGRTHEQVMQDIVRQSNRWLDALTDG